MKGIVFTEFLEMVEDKFSPEVADDIIEQANLVSGGAYTSVGTYHHSELISMVVQLSQTTDIDVKALIEVFGEYMLNRFTELYPSFFENVPNCFDFLDQIENHVHIEVKKLYPDAELPTFTTTRPNAQQLIMEYQSQRPFAPLAEGLINGTIAFYKEDINVEVKPLSGDQNTHVAFHLTKRDGL